MRICPFLSDWSGVRLPYGRCSSLSPKVDCRLVTSESDWDSKPGCGYGPLVHALPCLPCRSCAPGPSTPTPAMNEVKEALRSVEQRYKLFQQQQFTFIAALEHCRDNAHDKIRPIATIGQVSAHRHLLILHTLQVPKEACTTFTAQVPIQGNHCVPQPCHGLQPWWPWAQLGFF